MGKKMNKNEVKKKIDKATEGIGKNIKKVVKEFKDKD